MVAFNHYVPESKKRNLTKEFKPELSAFTSFLLSIPEEKIENVIKGNFTSRISATVWETQIRSDGMAAWLNDCIIEDAAGVVRVGSNRKEWDGEREYDPDISTLYGSYARYCSRTGRSVKSVQNFSAELLEMTNRILGWVVDRDRMKIAGTTVRVLKGIRLRTKHDDNIPIVEELIEDNQLVDKGSNNVRSLVEDTNVTSSSLSPRNNQSEVTNSNVKTAIARKVEDYNDTLGDTVLVNQNDGIEIDAADTLSGNLYENNGVLFIDNGVKIDKCLGEKPLRLKADGRGLKDNSLTKNIIVYSNNISLDKKGDISQEEEAIKTLQPSAVSPQPSSETSSSNDDDDDEVYEDREMLDYFAEQIERICGGERFLLEYLRQFSLKQLNLAWRYLALTKSGERVRICLDYLQEILMPDSEFLIEASNGVV